MNESRGGDKKRERRGRNVKLKDEDEVEVEDAKQYIYKNERYFLLASLHKRKLCASAALSILPWKPYIAKKRHLRKLNAAVIYRVH